MKSLQRPCAAVTLAFVLALPVLAGEMSTGPGIASPPPSSPSSNSQTSRGEMDTGVGAATTEGETFSGVVWGVVKGVLALL